MTSIISVKGLTKTYASGHQALKTIDLDIRKGEIFALLGPNGAGKTTLISIICGIVNPSLGVVLADGHDVVKDYRAARTKIGLVPQELNTDAFETVWATVSFSRGLFGKPRNDALIEKILRDLSLWDKKDSKIMALSGGMKRRVMIAKALSHEPTILFLDEPTAGVDVELRRDMWEMVRGLREKGVTIILTTHYLEEAEALCERIAMLKAGQIVALDRTQTLMQHSNDHCVQLRLGSNDIPDAWKSRLLPNIDGSWQMRFSEYHELEALLAALRVAGIPVLELHTQEPDLEDVFTDIMRRT